MPRAALGLAPAHRISAPWLDPKRQRYLRTGLLPGYVTVLTCPTFAAHVLPGEAARHGEVVVSGIWGNIFKEYALVPAIYNDVLPSALSFGTYQPAPPARIVGNGLAAIPQALHQLQRRCVGLQARRHSVEPR